jgi:hypothetical protein
MSIETDQCGKFYWCWPSYEVIDSMSLDDYTTLVRKYMAFHTEYAHGSCIYVERQKTPVERKEEEDSMNEWLNQHPLPNPSVFNTPRSNSSRKPKLVSIKFARKMSVLDKRLTKKSTRKHKYHPRKLKF